MSSFLSLSMTVSKGLQFRKRLGALEEVQMTYQTSGFSSMNFFISASHSLSWSTTTSIPRCLRYASPPTKVLFSPMTTRPTLYITQAPVHMSHGDNVVYMVAPRYAEAGSLPVFSRAEISPCDVTPVKLYTGLCSKTAAYMKSCAAFLDSHIMTSAQDPAICRHQTSPYWYPALLRTLLGFFKSSDESGIFVHL